MKRQSFSRVRGAASALALAAALAVATGPASAQDRKIVPFLTAESSPEAVTQLLSLIEQFEKAGRDELAENEKAEIVILSKYLPAALSSEQIEGIVAQAISETGAASKADMGKAMKRAQELSEGRADGKLLSAAVMKRLS